LAHNFLKKFASFLGPDQPPVLHAVPVSFLSFCLLDKNNQTCWFKSYENPSLILHPLFPLIPLAFIFAPPSSSLVLVLTFIS
jgi:hypothetical protein